MKPCNRPFWLSACILLCLATPVQGANFSGHLEKSTKDLTPQPPSLVGKGENSKPNITEISSAEPQNLATRFNLVARKGENSKPLSLQERGLERGFEKNLERGFQRADFSLSTHSRLVAQIVPDATLPVPTVITPKVNTQEITGGTNVGNNLFHSFEQFSVPTNGTAHFDNAPNIQNIFSRVTGGTISQIDGAIKANGTANLFLLNPNGIIFGPQASLNIGGAFFASTASRLIFADGSEFGKPAVNGGAALLTLSVPIGLQLDSQSASIGVRGATLQATGLTLVGSNIHLDGATLRSDRGTIYLGTSQISDLRLPIENQNLGLQSEISNLRSLGDIQLSNGSLINSSGSIQLQGRRIILTDGSTIVTATQNLPGGALTVMASELLELAGTTPDGQLPSALFTETQGAGVGGDVQITANRLIVRDGAQILTNTTGSGAGGNITIHAAESVELAGESASFPSGVLSQTEGTAGAGEITINTNRLIVRDGAQANTNTFGAGNAGMLTVRATNSVELSGEGQAPSGLFAQADSQATGAGGNLTVETGRLLVRDGAQVSTSTFGSGAAGNLLVRATDSVELSGEGQATSGLFAQVEPEATGAGGNLTVETGRLLVRDGAQVSSTTFGDKPARNLTINASGSIEVRGTTADGQTPSGLYSRSTTAAAAGSLYIMTDKFTIRNRGFVAVSNPDFGDAGIVDITANRLVVDRGSISAETAAGEGGNLFIQTKNFQLRHNSSVTTTAGGTGNGGNITLTTTNFVALENSDIRADAYAGNGGNILISTRGLFRSPDSEITASSKLGVNGVVTIQTPDDDAAKNFVLLDSRPNNTEQLLANSCLTNRNRKRGRFVVTGTGGLPSHPLDELNIQYDVMGVRELVAFEGGGKRVPIIANGRPPTPTQIVEANAVAIGPNGEVMLVAQALDDLTPDVC